MRVPMTFLILGLAACGGEAAPEPAPAPKAEPKPEVAPAPKPEPKPEVDFDSLDDAGKHAHLMEVGKNVYNTGGSGGIACVTCHGPDGKGTPGAFPPLVGQKDHMGDCAKHAGLVIDGLMGEMVVDGVKYNGVMVPQGPMLDDLSIAAAITYERNSWGNDFGDCAPSDVAGARKK